MTGVEVYLDTGGRTSIVGTARILRLRGVDTTEFTYDDGFLAGRGWEISPDLPIAQGRAVLQGLPGALLDSAPDAWGRNLIVRRAAARAREAGHVSPTLTEADHLLGVADSTRQGALRFRLAGEGPYLAEGTEVPQLVDLATLLHAATRVVENSDAHDAVETLLDAGSGSLGGARPKASVSDAAVLYVAKFPHPQDRWDIMRWEAVALDLAEACGLRTPARRLLDIGGTAVLLVERFDRVDGRRIPYLSGQSLVGAEVGARCDYLELAEALTTHGSDVTADLEELWRRIAFSVAVNNTDDHMRNHGALRSKGGWTLSPVFDVNPDPNPAARRMTSISGATAPQACLEALFQIASAFDLGEAEATAHWRDLVAVTSGWRRYASDRGINDAEQAEFAPVLDRWSATV